MSAVDVQNLVVGTIQGIVSSTVFILSLLVGFCVVFGFTKLRKTAGGAAMVIKSLDERLSHRPMEYLSATTPRGRVDLLQAPELVEAAARRSL
jgi:acid phosphatase family membrane protein YuiD